MVRQVSDRILEIQEAFRNDAEYTQLWTEQVICNDRFLEVLGQLPAEQRTVVEDYIGVLIEIHLRTLIYAVSK